MHHTRDTYVEYTLRTHQGSTLGYYGIQLLRVTEISRPIYMLAGILDTHILRGQLDNQLYPSCPDTDSVAVTQGTSRFFR